jgi:hypothetical protein
VVENQVFCIGLAKDSRWSSIGVNIDNTFRNFRRTFTNAGATHGLGVHPNGVVVVAVQNDWSIWRNFVEPSCQKLSVRQNASVISAADYPVIARVCCHPSGDRLLNFSDAASRCNRRPGVFAPCQNWMRVPVSKGWNDDSTGAVDYLIAFKIVRSNLVSVNREAVRKT